MEIFLFLPLGIKATFNALRVIGLGKFFLHSVSPSIKFPNQNTYLKNILLAKCMRASGIAKQ